MSHTWELWTFADGLLIRLPDSILALTPTPEPPPPLSSLPGLFYKSLGPLYLASPITSSSLHRGKFCPGSSFPNPYLQIIPRKAGSVDSRSLHVLIWEWRKYSHSGLRLLQGFNDPMKRMCLAQWL